MGATGKGGGRPDDALRKAIEYRRYRCGVLRRGELAFLLDRFLDAFVIVHPESFDPGHWVVSPFEGLRLISSREHVAFERRVRWRGRGVVFVGVPGETGHN